MNPIVSSFVLSSPANNGPAPGEPPAPGMVLVYFDLEQQSPKTTQTRVGFVNPALPLEIGDKSVGVGTLFTFAKRPATDERPADEFPVLWLWDSAHIAPATESEAVYYARNLDAALNENSGRFNLPPLSGGDTSYSLSYLLKEYRDAND